MPDYKRQLDKLKKAPNYNGGLPEEFMTLSKGKIPASHCKTIVVDEADRMLDKMNADMVKGYCKEQLSKTAED